MSSEPPELGPRPSGPDFAPPSESGSPGGAGPGAHGPIGGRPGGPGPFHAGPGGDLPRPDQDRFAAPRSRLPAVITAAVIVLVAVIVVVATIRGGNDLAREPSGTGSTPTPSAVPSESPNSISFSSDEGSGRLTVLSHRWSTHGPATPTHGAFLQLRVRISVTDGHVSYGPQYFQSFDASSDLFQTSVVGARPPLLGSGVLRGGQSVTGGIAFDMPRGDVTLLMTNSLLESVTALRIAD